MDQPFKVTPLSGVNNNPSPSDMNTIPIFNLWPYLKWLILAAVVVVVLAMLYFWLFRATFSDGAVSVELTAPEEIASGEQVSYQVMLENKNKVALNDVRLTFYYPTGTTIVRDNKIAQFTTEDIKIGDLLAGEKKQIDLPVYLVGDQGEVKKAKVLMVYVPANVRSSFQKEVTQATTVSKFNLALNLSVPASVTSGQTMSYVLDYRNESEAELTNLQLQFSYPTGFAFTNAIPPSARGNSLWRLDKLAPGESGKIIINGRLLGKERDSKAISLVVQQTVGDLLVDYEKISPNTAVAGAPLVTSVLLNGGTDFRPKLGDDLDYQILFTNNSRVDLLGLTVVARLNGTMFDFSRYNGDGLVDQVKQTITWSAASTPLLNRLAAGQQGAVNFRIALKRAFPSGSLGAKDFSIGVTSQVDTPTLPPGFSASRLTATNELVTRIATLPTLDPSANRSDPNFGGGGPLPPKVGERTYYTVHWVLTNGGNALNAARLVANLPTGVNWENKVRTSNGLVAPIWRSAARQIIWDVGAIPAGLGSTQAKYEAWFQISIIPTSTQSGQRLKLVEAGQIEGNDSLSQQAIVVRFDAIDNDHLLDYPNQGTVGE